MSSEISFSAPARVDLSGGAADMFGFSTLAVAIDLRARAKIEDCKETYVEIEGIGSEKISKELKFGTKFDIIKAAIKRFKLYEKNFKLEIRTEIPELSHVFDLKGITYSFTPKEIKSYSPKEGISLYCNEYDLDTLLANIKNYLYLSKEAETDFPDIENLLDDTYLDKIYNSGVSGFYRR